MHVALVGAMQVRSAKGSKFFMRSIFLAFVLVTAAFAAGKVSRDLDGLVPGTFVDVIIQWRNPPAEGEHAKVGALGGRLKQSFTAIRGSLYSIPAMALDALSRDPQVVFITPDRKQSGLLNNAIGA